MKRGGKRDLVLLVLLTCGWQACAGGMLLATSGTTANYIGTPTHDDGWANGERWEGGIAPNKDFETPSEGAAGLDYVIGNGGSLRPPDVAWKTIIFGGKSLQLGAMDFSGSGNFVQKGNLSWVRVDDLRLYKGFWRSGANNKVAVRGNVTVYSKSNDPFAFSTKPDYEGGFACKLAGAEDACFSFGNGGQANPLYMVGDATDFKGTWVVPDNSYIYPWKGTFGFSAETKYGLSPDTSAKVFGRRDTFKADSVIFGANVVMRFEAGYVLAASDNRGMKLNGRLTYRMVNGNAHHVYWPICGVTGAELALSGDGYFNLHTNCAVRMTVDRPGRRLVLRRGASIDAPGGLVLTAGQCAEIGDVADVPISNPTLDNAAFVFAADGAGVARVRLSGNVSVSGRIAIGMSMVSNVTETTDVPVIIVDKGVSREFTSADFDPWGVQDRQIANAKEVVVTRNEQGDQVVSVRLFPYVKSNAVTAQLTDPDTWLPTGVPTEGHSYIVWGHTLRSGSSDWSRLTVPGDDWVLYNPDRTTFGGVYMSKEARIYFESIRMLDLSTFRAGQHDETRTMEWAGNIDIRTTEGRAATFMNCSGLSGAVVSANLSGRGTIVAMGNSDDQYAYDRSLSFTGENAGYVGKFVATNETPSATRPFVLKAQKEANFGGNPETFAVDAWRLGDGVVFTPTAPVTFDDANRGVTFMSGSSVNTAVGCDFAIRTPVVFNGTFSKCGAGEFAFGLGGVTLAAEASIAVVEGEIRPQHRDAFKGASVSFAAGTALVLEAGVDDTRAGGGLDLTTTVLQKSDEAYVVRIDYKGSASDFRAPMATFASEAQAADFVATTRVKRPKGYAAKMVAEGCVVMVELSRNGLVIEIW